MGSLHRIIKAKNRKFSDPEFTKLLRDSDTGKLKHDLSPFFTRPLYAHTKAEVGGHKTWHSELTTN